MMNAKNMRGGLLAATFKSHALMEEDLHQLLTKVGEIKDAAAATDAENPDGAIARKALEELANSVIGLAEKITGIRLEKVAPATESRPGSFLQPAVTVDLVRNCIVHLSALAGRHPELTALTDAALACARDAVATTATALYKEAGALGSLTTGELRKLARPDAEEGK